MKLLSETDQASIWADAISKALGQSAFWYCPMKPNEPNSDRWVLQFPFSDARSQAAANYLEWKPGYFVPHWLINKT